MARSSGYNLSAFYSPRFGRPFIKRVVSRQRRRLGIEEAKAEEIVARLNLTMGSGPNGFHWYDGYVVDEGDVD